MTKILKYVSFLPSTKKEIANIYKDHIIAEHIESLYQLIEYQMKIISEQRSVIIASKHQAAWQQYYKSIDEYDTQVRRYFTKQELEFREN